jgi:hypothetical protein
MANSAGLTTSFKVELMLADHNFGVSSATRGSTAADTLKMALYQTSASIGPTTTAYTATGEVSSANYTAGGATVTNATVPTSSGTTAYWTPSASVSWTTVTFTTDCALLYNSSRSNKSIGSYTFSSQTVTAGNFTLTMPANAAATALIQIA